MTSEISINKVVITEKAKFDYNDLFGQPIPRKDLKAEAENYIDNVQKTLGCYIRLKYYDETADRMLMLFFYRGIRLGIMQMWELQGICLENDWTEELEECGQIRAWITSALDTKEDADWVWDLRVRQEREQKEREDYNDK